MNAEDNPNPVVYDGGQTIHFRSLQELLEITDLQDELSARPLRGCSGKKLTLSLGLPGKKNIQKTKYDMCTPL